MTEEKYPWQSKEEWVAFIGLLANFGAAFGLFEVTTEQIGVIGSLGFALIMIVRGLWTSGKLTFKKS